MTRRYALCLDQGGSSSRAILFDEQGVILALEQESVRTSRPHDSWVEQDAEELVASLMHVTERLLGSLTFEQQANLGSCALITQRSSMVCCQKSTGKAITPVLSWQDTRASDWLVRQKLNEAVIYKKTGLFPNAHFGASKMHWCLNHLPEVKALADSDDLIFLPLGAYLSQALTDTVSFNVDPANASRTLLMNIESLSWDNELLTLFGIVKEQLPIITATRSCYGDFNVAGVSLPLRVLNGDQSAAAFFDGVPEKNTAYINLGTGGFVFTLIQSPVQAEGLLNSIIYSESLSDGGANCFVLEGTVNGAGSAIDWFNETYQSDLSFSDLDGLLNHSDCSCVFLNGIGGLGSPDWVANFHSRFVGEGSTDEKLVAVIESILFLLQRNIQKMASKGVKINAIELGGGLSRLSALCQKLSDLTGFQVSRSDVHEASSRGAAYLLLGSDLWGSLEKENFLPLVNYPLQDRYDKWSGIMDKEIDRIKLPS